MPSFLTILTLLLSAALTSALVARGTPSGVPCVHTCPAQDTAHNAVSFRGESSNPLNCQYGAPTWNCLYDKTTGALTADHDDGFCPLTVVCSTTSRRDTLPRSPRRHHSTRQVDTSKLKTRNQLGAAKRSKKSV